MSIIIAFYLNALKHLDLDAREFTPGERPWVIQQVSLIAWHPTGLLLAGTLVSPRQKHMTTYATYGTRCMPRPSLLR